MISSRVADIGIMVIGVFGILLYNMVYTYIQYNLKNHVIYSPVQMAVNRLTTNTSTNIQTWFSHGLF